MAKPSPDSYPRLPRQEIKPGGWSVVLFVWPWLVLLGLAGAAMTAALWLESVSSLAQIGVLVIICCVLLALIAGAIIRDNHLFTLDDERISAVSGVFRRELIELRVRDAQSSSVSRSVLQRLLGLATIDVYAAGVGPAVRWVHVSNFAAHFADIQDRISGSRAVSEPVVHVTMPASPSPSPDRPRDMPVIGLVGGIGSGKSTVARAFESLGCLVIDSDVRAKAALDRPDVRRSLVEWWGGDIVSPEGRIDRAKVAAIVFGKPQERERLEKLVHPIVRQDRAQMIAEARTSDAKAVIVDAPLLFEAGVDAECDAVVFVDAPFHLRLARVRQTRGWDEQELTRRETAQLPLDEKRRRAAFVVENSGPEDALRAQVAEILEQVRLRTRTSGA